MRPGPRGQIGVSPVIATVLMVAITVVLVAVLYALIQSYITPPGGNRPIVALGEPALQPDGSWRINVESVSRAEALGNYQVAVLNGTAVAYPLTDLKNGTLGPPQGGIGVAFTDFDSRGTLNGGDFFIVTGLTPGNRYEFDLAWKPGAGGVVDRKTITP